MLEILVLIRLGRFIAARARDKGRSGGAYVLLLLALWFGFEILGGFAVGVGSMVLSGDDEPSLLFVYVGALVFAVLGAVLAFQIVDALPPVADEPDPDQE